jgi:predicted O-methyltransferase YrrM
MRPGAYIPPNSFAATVAHRALMEIQAWRLAGSDHPRAAALAAVLTDVARGRLAPAEREWIARVEAWRTEIPFEMVAAGADPTPDEAPSTRLANAWEVCRWVSIPPVWGRFLTRLVRELRLGACLELGTAMGLSGAYQAAALELDGNGELSTLDFHAAARIAERGFSELGLGHRVKLRFGDIDEILPEVLEEIAPIDYALLDAEHSESATIRHFDLLRPYLGEDAIVVLDDVNQTEEMRRAWRTVIRRPGVSLAVPLRRIGVVCASAAGTEPSNDRAPGYGSRR